MLTGPNTLASHRQRLGGFIYQDSEDIHRFEGLRSFKEKFRPVWTPHHIACGHALAVTHAFRLGKAHWRL
ncbi:MAG: phosphatidylglycerol lysyltransferase domain-containing protein [Pseudomonadota bacterium]